MPNSDDLNLLLQAKALGLLSDAEVEACLDEIASSERAGHPLRLAQILLKKKLVQSAAILSLAKTSESGASPTTLLEELSQVAQVRAAVAPGARMGAYTLVREVARGGMGILFEARRAKDNARIALKVLSARASASDNVVERFRQEARIAAKLDHPNIIKVHDVGVEQGVHYIAMDFFEGRSLQELLREGRLVPRKAVEIVATVADAASAMHANGVLHRDIKPGNILVGRGGAVCLTDFGLAKDLARQDATLTQLGIALGTPAYMSPEQARGDLAAIGPWTDVYGLGAVLYGAVSGHAPVEADSVAAAIRKIANDPPPRLRATRPDAPEELERILLSAMDREPRDRPAAAALAASLRAVAPAIVMPPAASGELV